MKLSKLLANLNSLKQFHGDIESTTTVNFDELLNTVSLIDLPAQRDGAMTLSELIAKVDLLKQQHGDVDAVVPGQTPDAPPTGAIGVDVTGGTLSVAAADFHDDDTFIEPEMGNSNDPADYGGDY